jgi:hypothetical protein
MRTPEVSSPGAIDAAFGLLSVVDSAEDLEAGGLLASGVLSEAGGSSRGRTAQQLEADAQFKALAAECEGLPPPLVLFMVSERRQRTSWTGGNHHSTINLVVTHETKAVAVLWGLYTSIAGGSFFTHMYSNICNTLRPTGRQDGHGQELFGQLLARP